MSLFGSSNGTVSYADENKLPDKHAPQVVATIATATAFPDVPVEKDCPAAEAGLCIVENGPKTAVTISTPLPAENVDQATGDSDDSPRL